MPTGSYKRQVGIYGGTKLEGSGDNRAGPPPSASLLLVSCWLKWQKGEPLRTNAAHVSDRVEGDGLLFYKYLQTVFLWYTGLQQQLMISTTIYCGYQLLCQLDNLFLYFGPIICYTRRLSVSIGRKGDWNVKNCKILLDLAIYDTESILRKENHCLCAIPSGRFHLGG